MNSTETQAVSADQQTNDNPPWVAESPEMKKAPRLSHNALTVMLALMCIVPIATISAMWIFLPAVHEGTLECEFSAAGLPEPSYYDTDYRLRDEFEGGQLIVRNLSDKDWTHLNININRRYQIYDDEPIPAFSEKRFNISSFVSRSGARFSLRYNELKSARIYARRPTKERATLEVQFKDGVVVGNDADDQGGIDEAE